MEATSPQRFNVSPIDRNLYKSLRVTTRNSFASHGGSVVYLVGSLGEVPGVVLGVEE